MKQDDSVPLSKEEFVALAAFRHALRRFNHFSEADARKVGLTPQKYQALLSIKGTQGRDRVTIGELAENLMLRHHSAVGLVDRLEEGGLVIREPDTADRRQVYVRLTDEGDRLIGQLAATHRRQWLHLRPELIRLLNEIEPRTASSGHAP